MLTSYGQWEMGTPVDDGWVTRMQFGLLGPLTVRSGDAVLIPAGKQRVVLAALLLNANRVVPAEDLAEALWGAEPPPSAGVTVQNYVARLRKVLEDHGHSRIGTQPRGYMISVADDELDVTRFEALVAASRQAAREGSWDTAAAEARAALGLWRGDPLADVESKLLAEREVPRLTDLRLQAQETRIEADLNLGRHAEIAGELRKLAGAHPLREHLHALLMLALYRQGRQGEALAVYQAARRVLIEELGTEPGQQLQNLHQQILAADPALELREPTRPAASAGRVVPRELPAGVRHFTGRARELAALTKLLDEPAEGRGIVLISAIGGTAGVGKTALAVQWAHQVAGRFPDGQLYLNLRGYDPGEPVLAADALAAFLRTLGVPATDIPDDVADRARLYRSLLAGHRVLVVLDNARDGEQVRPLLPGEPGCAAVVTSRDVLSGLVAADGARRLDLDVLPLTDAVALLRSLIGPSADEDSRAAEELAGLCARLPLALRIAAELAAARPATPLADLAAELKASRLDSLDAGEDRADVRAVFSWSVRQLPGSAAEAFALLGLHPGTDFDLYAATALVGTSTGEVRRILGRLHRASLLQAASPGRYGMHDLLRAFAREQAAAGDGGESCHRALTRLFGYYLNTAAAAMAILFPAEAHLRPRIAGTAGGAPDMPDHDAARAWLDTERANLVAVVAHCAGRGWPAHATDLASTLFRYLMNGSYMPEARAIAGQALHAARVSGDVAAEASALNSLGAIAGQTGHFREAADHLQSALERYRQYGDLSGQARALYNLGLTEQQLHNLQSATGYYRDAITAFEDAGDGLGAARVLADLADAEIEAGAYDEASEHLQLALPVLRDAQDHLYEAGALERMGNLGLGQGHLAEAAGCFEQALAIYRRIAHPAGVANGSLNLGRVALSQGEHQQAVGYLREAATLFRQTGEQHDEILTLRSLAEALHGAGQSAAARTELAAALRLAAETGNTYQQASAHRDLAESHDRDDDNQQARHHWQQALDLYVQLGAPDADQARSRLSAREASGQR
jgi:DNA-binding SARP family transcriptional activator